MGGNGQRTSAYARAVKAEEYVVSFVAINALDLDGDERERLDDALHHMPGIRAVGHVRCDAESRTIVAAFAIPVAQAMAEAARDGGRLAKEVLLAARIPDARLVEMTVRMSEPAH
jgi:hypothetical protein